MPLTGVNSNFLQQIHGSKLKLSPISSFPFISLLQNGEIRAFMPLQQPQYQATTSLLSIIWIFLLWTFHINGIIQYVVFQVLLLSLSICFQRSFTLQHLSVLCSLLWPNNIPFNGYTTICFSILQSMDIWVVFSCWLV